MPTLGQHFLKSKVVARSIVEAAELHPSDIVLEIGPGRGVLTQQLLDTARHVTAVEKDPTLVRYLSDRFLREIDLKRLELIEGDARKMDFEKLQLKRGKFHIVANIPYYITGIFIRNTLSGAIQPKQMTLLVQKEVAERIARSKKESLLSLSVKAYGNPHYVSAVPAKFFTPTPKVDSAIITIDNISKKSFEKVEESHFFGVLHAGFAHKRKRLAGNLTVLTNKGHISEIFNNLSIDLNARAEDVNISKWLEIAAAI